MENSDFESDNEFCNFDDSDEDPTFDVVEETRSRISKISIKKSRKVKEIDLESEDGEEIYGVEIPELNEKDGKCFEKVEEIIKAGQVDKLKVDQCKVYLRKFGLRLTGNKGVLVERIKEHLEVINGGGEKKFPMSSFVLNCRGDACTGDIVMFEQKVYEMFNIASRSAMGPPCGTRVVAGRIVKESYGAAKQQHTFTIEVLWSTGKKPLPPLHPLLIKGRNLYRLKTTRQRWADEDERRKVIQEKHSRGNVARHSRETRIKEKEARKKGIIKRTESKINQQHPEKSVPKAMVDARSTNNVLHQNNDNHHSINQIQTKFVQQHNTQQHQRYQPHTINAIQHHLEQSVPKAIIEAKSINNVLLQINDHQSINQIQPKFVQQHNTQRHQHHQPRTINGIQHRPQLNRFQNENFPLYQDNNWKSHEPKNKTYFPRQHEFHHRQSSNQFRSPTRQWGQQRPWCRYYNEGCCRYGENCRFRHH